MFGLADYIRKRRAALEEELDALNAPDGSALRDFFLLMMDFQWK